MPFVPDSDRPGWTPDPQPCRDPSHFPPGMMVWQTSGTWVCPSCGHRTRIFVPRVTCELRASSTVPCSTAPGGYEPSRTLVCVA